MVEKLGISVSDSLIREVTYYAGKQVSAEDGKKGKEAEKNLVRMEYSREKAGVLYLMVDGSMSYLGGAEEFKKRLPAVAVENGYGRYAETVLISNGATWIRNI
jgi:hypothetical protein